jgi:SAM-dependent methyltransferase
MSIKDTQDHNIYKHFDLYIGGMFCGLMNLMYFPQDLLGKNWVGLKRTLKTLICPIDLWRYREFLFVLRHLKMTNDECPNILDIGSPKWLSLNIANKYDCKVISTDIAPKVMEEVNWYKRINSKRNLEGLVENAINLSFEDNKFSTVYSISCFEHIGNDGDMKAIKEAARVLKPGGRLLITVPFVTKFRELWTDKDPWGCQLLSPDGKIFFSRYYDQSSLSSRLIGPSGLKLLEIKAWQEITRGWYDTKYIPRLLKSSTKTFTKFLDYYYNKRRIQDICPNALTNCGCVGIALKKTD